jgi:hypothetical protein
MPRTRLRSARGFWCASFNVPPSLQEYHGGYWESRSSRQWEGCRDIFGE